MQNKEFKFLVDSLIKRIAHLQLRDYAEAKNIIEEFNYLEKYSKQEYLSEDIRNIKSRFLSAIIKNNDKAWDSASEDLQSVIGDLVFIPLYSEQNIDEHTPHSAG